MPKGVKYGGMKGYSQKAQAKATTNGIIALILGMVILLWLIIKAFILIYEHRTEIINFVKLWWGKTRNFVKYIIGN